MKKVKTALLALAGLVGCSAPVKDVKSPLEFKVSEVAELKRVCPKSPPNKHWMCRLKNNRGIELEESFQGEKLKMNLWTTKKTRALLKGDKFDIDGKTIAKKDFFDYVMNTFSRNCFYYNSFAPHPVEEINIVIYNVGKKRRLSGRAIIGTNIMEIGIRKWNELREKKVRYRADSIAMHEYTHIQDYAIDIKENTRFKEVKAIVFESVGLMKHYGLEQYIRFYEKTITPMHPVRVLRDEIWNRKALRFTMYRFAINLMNGLYSFKGDNAEDKLKEFGTYLISSKKTGEAGFNEAAKSSGITFAKQPLTFDTLQQHTYEELVRRSK